MSDFFYRLRILIEFWFGDRQPLDALLALPAAGSLTALGAVFILAGASNQEAKAARFEKIVQHSLRQEDLHSARVAAGRLALFDNHAQKGAYLNARIAHGLGQHSEALRLIRTLAPDDKPGYAPAHVARAGLLLSANAEDTSRAKTHVQLALTADPTHADARELAARIAIGESKWSQALDHLEHVSLHTRGDLLLLKALALHHTGLEQPAIAWAARSERLLRNQEPSNEIGHERRRVLLAQSLRLQRQFDKAVAMLVNGTDSLSEEVRINLAAIYHAWGMHLKQTSTYDHTEVLERVQLAVEYAPKDIALLSAFLTESCNSPGPAPHRVSSLPPTMGRLAPCFRHLHQAHEAWQSGQTSRVHEHLRAAIEIEPEFAAVLNNLAMCASTVLEKETDLELNLEVMEVLLAADPANSRYLDTRGHLLAKLARWPEAMRDLEQALPQLQHSQPTRLKLAEICEHLGFMEWRQGREHAARHFFHRAHALHPDYLLLVHNLSLAVALNSKSPSDLQDALFMIEPVLQANPHNPLLLNTRGHLLARLGRLREAARDLEAAVRGLPEKHIAHVRLMEINKQLEMNGELPDTP